MIMNNKHLSAETFCTVMTELNIQLKAHVSGRYDAALLEIPVCYDLHVSEISKILRALVELFGDEYACDCYKRVCDSVKAEHPNYTQVLSQF